MSRNSSALMQGEAPRAGGSRFANYTRFPTQCSARASLYHAPGDHGYLRLAPAALTLASLLSACNSHLLVESGNPNVVVIQPSTIKQPPPPSDGGNVFAPSDARCW